VGACAHDQGVKGGDRASPAAGTGRGRRGYSGELGEALLCVKGRRIGQGFLLTACRRRRRAQKRREGAGGGNLATAADRAALRCGRGAAATGVGDRNLRQHVVVKPLAIPRIKKKERRDQSFTGGDELTAAAGTRGGGVGGIGVMCVKWSAAGAKGRRRGSCASLNRGAGR
jgi:hypothetical protein